MAPQKIAVDVTNFDVFKLCYEALAEIAHEPGHDPDFCVKPCMECKARTALDQATAMMQNPQSAAPEVTP